MVIVISFSLCLFSYEIGYSSTINNESNACIRMFTRVTRVCWDNAVCGNWFVLDFFFSIFPSLLKPAISKKFILLISSFSRVKLDWKIVH
jgi:hypothetical protein